MYRYGAKQHRMDKAHSLTLRSSQSSGRDGIEREWQHSVTNALEDVYSGAWANIETGSIKTSQNLLIHLANIVP